MRRYWSVILLGARGVTGKLLALLAVLAAAEAALVAAVGLHTSFLVHMLDSSHLSLAFGIALATLAVICCLWGSDIRGGRCAYTLARLRVGEMTVVVLWGLCYTLAFLVLMGFQLLVILAACRWSMGTAPISPQSVFLAAHQSQLFHALLPLEEWGVYVRNGLYALSLGLTCSAWSFWRRRNLPGIAVFGVVLLAAIFFPADLGGDSAGPVVGILTLAVAAAALAFVWKEVRHGTD